eukprot:c4663_g2_i1.p1 GENE.c4663_g2_i1~~c4663_g2_i1.p1  ORF type:complete len:240 (+),score=115.85 c4663_g2_i1:41-721(+)
MEDESYVSAEKVQNVAESMMDDEEQEQEEENAMFPPVAGNEGSGVIAEKRQIPVPPHRLTPLRQTWQQIYQPVVQYLKLQIRYNTTRRCVEIRTCQSTLEQNAIQKAEDFVRAFLLGFAVEDAIALLRIEDLYVDSFEIGDVRTLEGEHLSRAIGRIAGRNGMTKFTIENATRTRIVLADRKVHILGSFSNTKIAKDAIVELVRGSPANKVYGRLRTITARMTEKF